MNVPRGKVLRLVRPRTFFFFFFFFFFFLLLLFFFFLRKVGLRLILFSDKRTNTISVSFSYNISPLSVRVIQFAKIGSNGPVRLQYLNESNKNLRKSDQMTRIELSQGKRQLRVFREQSRNAMGTKILR